MSFYKYIVFLPLIILSAILIRISWLCCHEPGQNVTNNISNGNIQTVLSEKVPIRTNYCVANPPDHDVQGISCTKIKNKTCTENVACRFKHVSFFTREQILNNLRSKWLVFIGDSSTRAMALALFNTLDLEQTHVHDFERWYNSTDPQEYLGKKCKSNKDSPLRQPWKGLGGDIMRADYLFEFNKETGHFEIVYKKATMWFDQCVQSYKYPNVFLPPDTPLGASSVRITFSNARGTNEIEHFLNKVGFPGNEPDIIYANVGAWHRSCGDPDKIFKQKTSKSQIIWGTLQSHAKSACDKYMKKFPLFFATLDRTLFPNTQLGKELRLSGVHYAHLVNIFDVMNMFTILWGHQYDNQTVYFNKFCSVVGNSVAKIQKKYGIHVPLPNQGWKTPWKLPCRFTIDEKQ